MFESGDCNIDLEVLRGVMALSSGNSIYVASALLSDPSKNTSKHPVQRVLGNLGRSELALLLPPSNPVLKDYDVNSWQMINHLPFDGTLGDSFASTSLHLSFTDFEMPVDVGARGLRDKLVILVETLVSINDGGKPLGDLDIISMFKSKCLNVTRKCLHQPGKTIAGQGEPVDRHGELVSIDCWDEIFDSPSSTGIVRAYGNWQARLAAAAASIQRGKRTLVLPHKPCLQCIGEYDEIRDFDVIIA
ncbi:hypothetical protein B0O99DRAFT_520401 [Bisporella sp. PMI_857]|nr:hypothetical protein B0O99DRAFT_520401 [Bisporella sp. PMI_857]